MTGDDQRPGVPAGPAGDADERERLAEDRGSLADARDRLAAARDNAARNNVARDNAARDREAADDEWQRRLDARDLTAARKPLGSAVAATR